MFMFDSSVEEDESTRWQMGEADLPGHQRLKLREGRLPTAHSPASAASRFMAAVIDTAARS